MLLVLVLGIGSGKYILMLADVGVTAVGVCHLQVCLREQRPQTAEHCEL